MVSGTDRIISLQPVPGIDIAPLGSDVVRPLVSVMLPVYEPNRFLIEALKSVLSQDLGPDKMQIAVVDDSSPTRDVAELIRAAARDRPIEHFRTDRNQGLAGNWNTCIRQARGQIVHILHQDDWISGGFYERLLPPFERRSTVGMAFSRYAIAESPNRVVRISHRERWRAGVLSGWLEKISERQRIQCASVMVRRSVYERLGGYRLDLCYALDWEMWVRIAASNDVWYEPKRLAAYRRHVRSETSRLQVDDSASFDELKAIELFSHYLPVADRAKLKDRAYRHFAQRELKQLGRAMPRARQEIAKRLRPVRESIDRAGSPALAKRLAKEVEKLERRFESRHS